MGISKCVLMPVGSMCTDAAGEETADSTPSCSQDLLRLNLEMLENWRAQSKSYRYGAH